MAEIELMMLDTPKTDYDSKKKKKQITKEDISQWEKDNAAFLNGDTVKNKVIEMDMNEFLNK